MTDIDSRLRTETLTGHWIEWLTGGLSLLVVVGLIGWIGFRAVTAMSSPALLEVQPSVSVPAGSMHRIDFTVINRGQATAATVTVRGSLVSKEVAIETAEVTFDYVPGESEVHGAFLFQANPADAALEIHAVSYSDP